MAWAAAVLRNGCTEQGVAGNRQRAGESHPGAEVLPLLIPSRPSLRCTLGWGGGVLLRSRAPFKKLVQEMASAASSGIIRLGKDAVDAVQVYAEDRTVDTLRCAQVAALAAGRQTVTARDVQLVRWIRGERDELRGAGPRSRYARAFAVVAQRAGSSADLAPPPRTQEDVAWPVGVDASAQAAHGFGRAVAGHVGSCGGGGIVAVGRGGGGGGRRGGRQQEADGLEEDAGACPPPPISDHPMRGHSWVGVHGENSQTTA